MGSHGNAPTETACGLAGEVVRTFGKVRLPIVGTSMVPCILPGDLVLVHRASLDEISQGEVVLFIQNGRLLVHRVVGRACSPGNTWLITRGDRERRNDPPVSSQELLGRVVSIERDNRELPVPPHGSNRWIARLLQASDRATYLYLRLAARWRTLQPRRIKCQA
jgi:hypothetical protein